MSKACPLAATSGPELLLCRSLGLFSPDIPGGAFGSGAPVPPSGRPVDYSCNSSTFHPVPASSTHQPCPWETKARSLVHTAPPLGQSQCCGPCMLQRCFPGPQAWLRFAAQSGESWGLGSGCRHRGMEGEGCPEAPPSPRKAHVHKPLGTFLIALSASWLFFLHLKYFF